MDVVIYPFLKPNIYTQGFATLVHSYRVMHRIWRFFTATCENGVRTHRREHQERRTPRFAGHDDVARRCPWAADVRGGGEMVGEDGICRRGVPRPCTSLHDRGQLGVTYPASRGMTTSPTNTHGGRVNGEMAGEGMVR